MDIRLDLDELDLVREVMNKARDENLHEIHHADAREFRKNLQERAEKLDSILRKLDAGWRSEPL